MKRRVRGRYSTASIMSGEADDDEELENPYMKIHPGEKVEDGDDEGAEPPATQRLPVVITTEDVDREILRCKEAFSPSHEDIVNMLPDATLKRRQNETLKRNANEIDENEILF